MELRETRICSHRWRDSKINNTKCNLISRILIWLKEQPVIWHRISKEWLPTINNRTLLWYRERIANNNLVMAKDLQMHKLCLCNCSSQLSSNSVNLKSIVSSSSKKDMNLKRLNNWLIKLWWIESVGNNNLVIQLVSLFRCFKRTCNNKCSINRWWTLAFKKSIRKSSKAIPRGSNIVRKWHMSTDWICSKLRAGTKLICLYLVNQKKLNSCFLIRDTNVWMK